jgi:hypothetical protein
MPSGAGWPRLNSGRGRSNTKKYNQRPQLSASHRIVSRSLRGCVGGEGGSPHAAACLNGPSLLTRPDADYPLTERHENLPDVKTSPTMTAALRRPQPLLRKLRTMLCALIYRVGHGRRETLPVR